MKAVILAGGHGTRISEESSVRPKPMIDIGHQPILWHIMKIYSGQEERRAIVKRFASRSTVTISHQI